MQEAEEVELTCVVPLNPQSLLFKNMPAPAVLLIDNEISDAVTTDFFNRLSVYVLCGFAPDPQGEGDVIEKPDISNVSLYATGRGGLPQRPDWQSR